MSVQILNGDCRLLLKTLPDQSVQCVVTSPPYFRLRDYGCAGQIGQEATPTAYVETLVGVFREVWRVLRDDGTCWINIASSYSNRIIESDEYIIKRELQPWRRLKVAQALSSVWSAYAPPESALSKLLDEGICETGSLRDKAVSGLSPTVHAAHGAKGQVLQQAVCEVGKPDKKEGHPNSPVSNVRSEIQQIRRRDTEEPGQDALLQRRLLVQLQPEGQSLSVAGGAARENEPRWPEMAQGCTQAGPVSLPDMPLEPEAGGASHPAVRDTQGATMGSVERNHALPVVPPWVQVPGDGTCRDSIIHSQRAGCCLEGLAFPKAAIPSGFEQFCEPRYVIKPKDDVLVPERLILALQQDGWFTRCIIIWSKPNPLPESVTDRPTRSHEYIFLLSKKPKYYYDHEAIKEPPSPELLKQIAEGYNGNATKDFSSGMAQDASATKKRIIDGYREKIDKQRGHSRRHDGFNDRWDNLTREEQMACGSNKRDVWTVAPANYPEAHFATFPPALIKPCILAGSKPGDTILDPFGGSGTVGEVALEYGRCAVLIELNPAYIPLIEKRTNITPGLPIA